MIRTEKEYQDVLKRIANDKEVMKKQEERLKTLGLKGTDLKKAMEPITSFHLQLIEEAKWYEQVKSGHFRPTEYVDQIGSLLIGLRIHKGLTQKQLAEFLGVPESQVSRDEKNEYHGITVERAQKVLEALKAAIEIRVKEKNKHLVHA